MAEQEYLITHYTHTHYRSLSWAWATPQYLENSRITHTVTVRVVSSYTEDVFQCFTEAVHFCAEVTEVDWLDDQPVSSAVCSQLCTRQTDSTYNKQYEYNSTLILILSQSFSTCSANLQPPYDSLLGFYYWTVTRSAPWSFTFLLTHVLIHSSILPFIHSSIHPFINWCYSQEGLLSGTPGEDENHVKKTTIFTC